MKEEELYKGPIPEDYELARDQDPLPPEALVKFQFISRGPDGSGNYRWLLYSDGRLFLARHSGNVDIDTLPFDTDLPETPTKTLKSSFVKKVENQLKSADFLDQPPYQLREGVEGGAWYIVTARIDDQVHEVIYEAYSPSLVDFLQTVASR